MEDNSVFLELSGGQHDGAAVNLAMVRIVDQIREDHCRLWFSETNMVEAFGESAKQVLKYVKSRSIGTVTAR